MIPLFGRGYDVLVNVTNLCDARCVMCNIWKNQEGPSSWLSPAMMGSVGPLSTVSFAGGEPFLHKEIVELVRAVHKRNPRAKVVFSSNGFRTEPIVEKAARILVFHRNVQVTLSLDGVGEAHDRIRGIPGAWNKVNRTFDRLGEIGLKRRNFAFTITRDNYSALPAVYAHAQSKGAGLSLAVAQSSKFLNVEIPPLEFEAVRPHLEPIVLAHLKSRNPMDWVRAFFQFGVLRYLATRRRPIECDAFENQFMIDQAGEVLSCHPLLLRAGNLGESDLPKILSCPAAKTLKKELRTCHACWEVCTARSAIRTNLFRVGLWAAGNKVLAHLGLWSGRKGSRLFPATLERPTANARHPTSNGIP